MKAVLCIATATITAGLLILVLASLAGAVTLEGYSADYKVLNGVASVNVTIVLAEKISEFDWRLPEDAADVAVGGLGFKVTDLRSFKQLQVQGQPFDTVAFSYSTNSVLEKTKDSFFILDLASIESLKKSITVRLPEEATLKYSLDSPQASVIPKTDNIKTDGKSITIGWDDVALAKGSAILVIYKEAGQFNLAAIIAAVAVLLLGGVAVSYYRRKKTRAVAAAVPVAVAKKARPSGSSDLTKNLFEDEKKIVELLLGSGEEGMWQKQLEIKSEISKVKLSRKLRSLDQKGLIEKIPYGNANKIRLKRA